MEDCEKKKIVHLCLSNFYIDNYSYQENMLPKYHVRLGFDVTVIASLVSFNVEGKSCLLPSACEYRSEDGYKVIRMDYRKKPSRKFCKRFRFYTSTYKLLEQEKPDILFIHGTSFGDAVQVRKYLKKYPKNTGRRQATQTLTRQCCQKRFTMLRFLPLRSLRFPQTSRFMKWFSRAVCICQAQA